MDMLGDKSKLKDSVPELTGILQEAQRASGTAAGATASATPTTTVPISEGRTVTVESNRVLVPSASGVPTPYDPSSMTEQEFRKQLTGLSEEDKNKVIAAIRQRNPNHFKAS